MISQIQINLESKEHMKITEFGFSSYIPSNDDGKVDESQTQDFAPGFNMSTQKF